MRYMGRILFLICCLLNSKLSFAQPRVIQLEGPNQTPAALFVQDLLEKAYSNIGYQVEYRNVPLARSFVEANSGRLDGLRARVGSVADKYPNLIKVPYKLFDFKLVMLADRRVCGACDLSQLSHVVVIRGFKPFEDFIAKQDLKLNIIEVAGVQQALDILAAGRVQAAVLSDTNVPDSYYHLNYHWIKQTFAVLPDYHYLHNKHEDLVPKLLAEMQKLETTGYVAMLREKHKLEDLDENLPNIDISAISAISGEWLGFTDSDKATYWRVLDRVYQSQVKAVKHKSTNWKRAKSLFAQGHFDILMGAYDFEVTDNMIRSNIHIDYEWPVTAFGKDLTLLKRQLDGEVPATACYLLGYDFSEWLSSSIKPYEVSSQTDCERLLKAGRVDMLVDYDIDLPKTIVDQYPGEQIVGAKPLFAVFHNTLKGKKLKRIFEQQFRQLIVNDELLSLFPDKHQFDLANFIVKKQFKVKER
jgi:ABC-type amino acid transport substrate-binding protein